MILNDYFLVILIKFIIPFYRENSKKYKKNSGLFKFAKIKYLFKFANR